MHLVFISVLFAALSIFASSADAACKRESASGKTTTGCKTLGFEKPRTFEPLESGRARAGTLPGFVDIGGGTQVRVSGRVRTEFDYHRR